MKNSSFIIERVMNAPVASVWKAITDKDAMKQWYFDLAEFKPVVGFEFSFPGQGHKGEKYIHHCKITEVVKERKLAYSWRYEGFDGISFVHFELFAEGNSTRVKLTHEGLETFPQNNPDFAKESFAAGWTEVIGTLLKKFVEQPNG
ncbi:MAG TPA: SRPBCC domain-containing protein [Cyclobacteriaceae bacterium]|nr:SRPBCC domain-containing protein [Cyclobacteriaceae bacterium]